ncbi:MAG: DUF1127 domain-containing protein [Amaricoccus sp.]|uniref:DUF1127 domain-containing protein n=1 Tax=Amaricoccus sp. TaxID=1872485 RepID=UPI0039E2AC34
MLEKVTIGWRPVWDVRFGDIGARLVAWHGLWRSRVVLMRLDAAALRDVGITRAQAEAEARRSPLVD